MATIEVKNLDGKRSATSSSTTSVFGVEVNEHLLWEVVKAQRAKRARRHRTRPSVATRCAAAARSRTSRRAPATRARARPRAALRRRRQASSRPKPRDYEYHVPKKVMAGALRCALSLRAKEQKLVVVDELRRSTRPRPSAWPARSRRSASQARWSSTPRTTRTSRKSIAQPAEGQVPRARGRSTSTTCSTTRRSILTRATSTRSTDAPEGAPRRGGAA